jgi:hypothetical protein
MLLNEIVRLQGYREVAVEAHEESGRLNFVHNPHLRQIGGRILLECWTVAQNQSEGHVNNNEELSAQ